MSIWPKKCLKCGASVDYITPGVKPEAGQAVFGPCPKAPGNHIVEMKEYYHPGAVDIADVRDRCRFAPLMFLLASETIKDEQTGRLRDTHGVQVQWESSGRVNTSDPEIQYYLDRREEAGQVMSGTEGLSRWRQIYLTEEQQVRQAKEDLEAVNAQIKEQNNLLAAVKAKGQQRAAV